jgi:acyl-CoA synthetase (AMP-forming)/AMP-acid ligase II
MTPIIRCWRTDAERERFRALGLWGDTTLAERFDEHAAREPGRLAVADARVRWSYGELQDITRRLARVLLDLGAGPGAVVAAQLPSCALLPALHLACNRVGALLVPLSPAWREREVAGLLRTVEPVVLVAVGEDGDTDLRAIHDAVRADVPALDHVVYAREPGTSSLEARLAASAPLAPAAAAALRPDPDAPALAMVSSGTTGVPKASVWGGNDVVALLAHHFTSTIELHADDVAGGLAPASLGSTGYVFPVLAPLLAGATSVMLERWSPQAALELLVREGCTYATAIPTQLFMLLELPLEDADLSALGRFNNAGAPLAPDVAREIERRMGCVVHTIYGATDGGTPVMTAVGDATAHRHTTVGRVLPGTDLELRGGDGRPAADGMPGEVCWRGATKSYGYLNQPGYDAQAWHDGWFCSGDLGTIDGAGFLRIVGRTKDMIVRGGHNIFPAEVEMVVAQHPRVAAVAVVGIPDARLGERACAAIVGQGAGAPSVADLGRFLTEQGLARYKHPELVLALDAIPVNAGGKVDREALREAAAHGLRQEAQPASST